MLMALLLAASACAAAAPPIQCTAASEKPQWPTYHFFNNITRGPACYCSPAPCACPQQPPSAELVMEPLNDANAIFEFMGLFHVMMQAGGGNWTHGVSTSAAGPWFTEIDALTRSSNASLPWDSHQGPCDGATSFPDLGRAPFNGSTPVIMYGPDCGHGLPPLSVGPGRVGLGDAPRVEVALPKDPTDPMLRDWVKQTPGPVSFEGKPCSFPGTVWKSAQGEYWNMICAVGPGGSATVGGGPWARYRSDTPTLMKWHKADDVFTVSAETGEPQPVGCQSGPDFQPIPNPKPGGPTHMINSGSAGPMLLGTYDEKKEVLMINNTLGPQILDSLQDYGFNWGAVGSASDGRLLMVAWVHESGPCGDGQPADFGGCARSVASLIRELKYDHATDQLISHPVADYDSLRNATFLRGQSMVLAAGTNKTLPIPSSAGGALDIAVSFDMESLTTATSGFGLAVRAPSAASSVGGIELTFSVSAPDADGVRVVTIFLPSPPPPRPWIAKKKVLPYMNDTNLAGGDYNTTHMPAGTDPHACQALCLKDPTCMVWVYVIRGNPVGSGDCIFKNEGHGCPSFPPNFDGYNKPGYTTAGRGHEPIGHNCTGGGVGSPYKRSALMNNSWSGPINNQYSDAQCPNVGCHGPWAGIVNPEPCESICNGVKGCNVSAPAKQLAILFLALRLLTNQYLSLSLSDPDHNAPLGWLAAVNVDMFCRP